jgi:hypothetical protein
MVDDSLKEFDSMAGSELPPDEQLLSDFDSSAVEETPQTIVPPTPKDPDSTSSIIGRSVDQLQGALGSAVEVAGEATGSEYLQDAGKVFKEEQEAEASQYGTPSISSYKQVDFRDPSQVGGFLKQMGLGTLPATGAILGGGVAGAKVGGVTGGILGALVTALPINIGEVNNAIKEIDPESKSPWASILGGTAISSLDMVGLSSIAKPLLKTFGKDIVYEALKEQGVAKELAVGAIKGAMAEAPTEALQSVVQDATAATATNTHLDTEKVLENAINGAIGGALGGGVMGGGASTVAALENNQNIEGGAAPARPVEDLGPRNMAQRAWDTMGSEATALLEPLASKAPDIEKFVRKLRPDTTGRTASDKSIFEDKDLMVGNWRTTIETGMAGEDVDVAMDDYINGRKSKGSDAVRSVMEDVHKTATGKDVGLDVGKIDNMLPTRLDPVKLEENRVQFLEDIKPYVKNPEVSLDAWIATQSIDKGNSVPQVNKAVVQDANGNWQAHPQYQMKKNPETFRHKFAQGTVPPEFGHLEKSRAFGKVPQAIMEKYTKEESGDAKLAAVKDYLEGAAHRIAFAREFGPSGEKLNFAVVKGMKEAQEGGYKPSKQEVDRIYNLVDSYNGMYHRVESEGLKKVNNITSTVMTLKSLPLTVLSSLVEVALPSIRGDLKAAIVSVVPTIEQISRDAIRQVFKTVPRSEFSLFASQANITLQAATNVAAQRLGTNQISRGAAKVQERFFMANGLTLWTHFVRVYAAKTADTIFKRNLQDLAAGLPITSANGANKANQLRSMGVPVYTNEDAVALFAPKSFSERQTADAYRVLAIKRFTSQTVLEPNIADTPMWMNNGHLHMLAMLKRYPAAFGNTILPQVANKFRPSWAGSRTNALKGATSAMFVIGFMLSVGYMQDELKRIIKDGGFDGVDKRTEVQKFVDVMNGTLAPLQVSLATDFIAAPRYGTDSVSAVAGPLIGSINEGIKTIARYEKDQKEGHIWQWLYKQTPAAFYRPGKAAAGEFELEDMFD